MRGLRDGEKAGKKIGNQNGTIVGQKMSSKMSKAIKELTYGGKNIADICEALSEKYTYVGLRTQDGIPFALGPLGHKSHLWTDGGEETDYEFEGVSCTNVESEVCGMHSDQKKSSLMGYYFGNHLAIIVGDKVTYGEDPGEIILSDAKVVKILK